MIRKDYLKPLIKVKQLEEESDLLTNSDGKTIPVHDGKDDPIVDDQQSKKSVFSNFDEE